jgi:hypothetical protein
MVKQKMGGDWDASERNTKNAGIVFFFFCRTFKYKQM